MEQNLHLNCRKTNQNFPFKTECIVFGDMSSSSKVTISWFLMSQKVTYNLLVYLLVFFR